MARKRKSKSSAGWRNRLRRIAQRYAHAREDAQLAGLLPTVPEQALANERVDPRTQVEPPLLGIVRLAVRSDWSTPPEKKGAIVDSIVALVESPDTEDHVRIAAARTLRQMDRDQWERDNPDLAGQARGSVHIANSQRVITGDEAIRLLQEIERKTGTPIMSPAMAEIQTVADQVLPPEVL